MKRADERKSTNHQKSGREQADRMLTQKTGTPRPDWMSNPAKLPRRPPPLPAGAPRRAPRGDVGR